MSSETLCECGHREGQHKRQIAGENGASVTLSYCLGFEPGPKMPPADSWAVGHCQCPKFRDSLPLPPASNAQNMTEGLNARITELEATLREIAKLAAASEPGNRICETCNGAGGWDSEPCYGCSGYGTVERG